MSGCVLYWPILAQHDIQGAFSALTKSLFDTPLQWEDLNRWCVVEAGASSYGLRVVLLQGFGDILPTSGLATFTIQTDGGRTLVCLVN